MIIGKIMGGNQERIKFELVTSKMTHIILLVNSLLVKLYALLQ